MELHLEESQRFPLVSGNVDGVFWPFLLKCEWYSWLLLIRLDICAQITSCNNSKRLISHAVQSLKLLCFMDLLLVSV